MEQIIYSKFEIIRHTDTPDDIFDEYNYFPRLYKAQGAQIGGISVAVRHSKPPVVILMTYDEESDLLLRLKYVAEKDLVYTNLRK